MGLLQVFPTHTKRIERDWLGSLVSVMCISLGVSCFKLPTALSGKHSTSEAA